MRGRTAPTPAREEARSIHPRQADDVGPGQLPGLGPHGIKFALIRCGVLVEGGSSVTEVAVEADESFETALKRFKKQCEKAGLLSEFKKRQHDEKPSVRRKRKALAARKKAKRRERMSD